MNKSRTASATKLTRLAPEHGAEQECVEKDDRLPFLSARRRNRFLAITDDVIASHQKGADLYASIGVIPRRIVIADVYDRSFVLSN